MSLTIIIPTLNRSTLKRTINSVDHQTIPVKKLVRYDMLKIGAPELRNQMLQEVKTTWVGFCDDDDWLDIHYHEWLREVHGADLVLFNMKRPEGIILPDHTDIDKLIYNWVGISFALRTKIAKEFPFKDIVGEDYDLIMRVKEAGYRIKIEPRVAYYVGSPY